MDCLKKCIVAVCLVAFLLPLAACEKEGEMEKAGKQLDETMESLKDEGKKLFE